MQRLVTQQLKIGEKVYPKGRHELSEETMKDPHYAHYVKAGHIVAPPAQAAKPDFQTPEAKKLRQEMEAKFGVPKKGTAAPSSGDVKVEDIGDSGFEPKTADEEPQAEEAQAPVAKKSKR